VVDQHGFSNRCACWSAICVGWFALFGFVFFAWWVLYSVVSPSSTSFRGSLFFLILFYSFLFIFIFYVL
jgi:hypothetical protein